MPLTFRCQKEPPPDLPPIPIPGLEGIMSSDGVAKVFNLDPRLQDTKPGKHHIMAPREGGFLESIKASFSGKSAKTDLRTTPSRRKREKGKERERDLSFVILPRSASSLVPGKSSMPLPPMPSRDNRLPRHSNVFTGVPTPTDSAITSARNSQHVPSNPGTPVPGHPLRSSRSVPDWKAEQRKQYCYFEGTSDNELPRMPSAYEPQPISNPGMTAEGLRILNKTPKESETSKEDSSSAAPIGRYKRKLIAPNAINSNEAFNQQRSSIKSHISAPLIEKAGIKRRETQTSFLAKDGPENANPQTIPIRKQSQQRPDKSPTLSPSLQNQQIQVRRRSTADDQKPSSSASHRLPERPSSTFTYQTHRAHALCPVVEETPQPVYTPKWGSNWSPHLQQESELFFETGTRNVASEQVPVEMGIPSPRHKHKTRPASWSCPVRPTMDPSSRLNSRNKYEFGFMFPPTPPSSTGDDVWDDQRLIDGEPRHLWNKLRNLWNFFVMIWALIILFKSLQFLIRFVDIVVLEPGKFLYDFVRNIADG
jgi:hypothetical protein